MARKTDHTKQRANTSNTPRKTAKQWVEEGNTHFAEKDYLVDLIHWSGQFLEEHK